MKCLWKGSLSLSLGLCVSAAFAEEPVWRAVKPRPAAVQASDSPSVSPPLSATATLYRPTVRNSVPAAPPPPALLDPQLQPVLFVAANSTAESIARAKGDDVPKPMPVGGPTLTSDVKGTKPPPRLEPEPLGPPRGVIATTPDVISTGPIGSSPCGDAVTAGDDCCADGCGGIWLWNRGDCGPTKRFYANAEFLAWSFRRDRAPPLVTTGPLSDAAAGFLPGALGSPGTTVLFGGSQYGAEAHYGGRLTFGYWLGDCQRLGLEGSFLYLGERTTNFAASSTGATFLGRPFFDVNPDPATFGQNILYQGNPAVAGALLPQAGTVAIHASSRLWGAEANLRTNLCRDCCYRVDLIGGFRFLSLEERLNISETEVPLAPGSFEFSSLTDSFGTENRFYGAQLGIESEFRWRRWSVDVLGKFAAGAVHQSVDIGGSAIIIQQGGATTTFPGQGLLVQQGNVGLHSRTRFGFAPELGVKLGYQLTENIRLTVGYTLLYWTNVARPGRQIDTSVNSTLIPGLGNTGLQGPNRPIFAFHDNDFWAQGVSVGLEFRY